MESLNINKEVKGLAKFVGNHILPVLNTAEHQTVKDIIDCLEKKYGRTRLEKLVSYWMKFKENDFDDRDDFIQVM